MRDFCQLQMSEAYYHVEYWGAYGEVFKNILGTDDCRIYNVEEVISDITHKLSDDRLDEVQRVRCQGILSALNNYKDRVDREK